MMNRQASRAPKTCTLLTVAILLVACSEDNGGATNGGLSVPTDTGGDSQLFVPDTGGANDTGGVADVGGSDTGGAQDTGWTDTAPTDTASTDTAAVTDSAVAADVGPSDTASTDAGSTDSGSVTDTGGTTMDTGSAIDANPADSGFSQDSGSPADAGGTTWGAFKKLPCARKVNTNKDGTVNPFISPARDGQFYVSYVQKSGDLMLTWEDPQGCKTNQGPLQVNKTKGTVYYWGGIAVISDINGNFFAVWESKAKGADISYAWSKTGKDFSAPIELVTTSTNGQDPVLWTSGPGQLHAAWRGHHASKKQYDPYYASGIDAFAAKPFSTGVLVHDSADQDDQVALVTNSKGDIFLGWQSFHGDIFVAKSTDKGKTWSKAVQVNDVKGKANAGKANFMTITPDDRLVIAWWDDRKKKSGNENDVFADSSKDGVTWGVDVQINDNDARYQQDPSLAVGKGPGCKGAVYAVWQDFRSKKSYDIYISRSVDGGKTWQKNEPVANDLEGDEMNPAIAVDNTCVIGVAWRDSSKNTAFDIGTAYLKW